jgi:cyclophilin family peptidyl-prolyl cis-trans isomerase
VNPSRLPLRRSLCAALLLTTAPAAFAAPPAAPSNFQLTWKDADLALSWADNSSDEEGFYLTYRVGSSGAFSDFTRVNPNVTTFTDVLTSWPACTVFEWQVEAYNATGSSFSNIVTVTAPPRITSAVYISGLINTPVSHQIIASCPGATIASVTATGLPAWLSLNPTTGLITGTPTTTSRSPMTITVTFSNGMTANQKFRINVFRPVPALVAPVATSTLPDTALAFGTTPAPISLTTFFSDPDVSQASRVVFNTGTIDFAYYPDAAPTTVTNFLGYISRGDYTNSIIHRSIPGFVLQGGGYKAAAGAPSIPRQPAVINEPEITNARGTVAMAKVGSNPNSATSEFFISLANNASNLNNQNEGFTVFARVAGNGMAVADAIAALPIRSYASTNGVLTDCPVTNPPPPAFDPASLVKVLSAGPVSPLSFSASSANPAICSASITPDGNLLLNPTGPGTALITITATDLDNQSISRSFTTTVDQSFAPWLASQNFSGNDALPDSDPDRDNRSNLLEFAFLSDPRSPNQSSLPTPGIASISGASHLTLAFPIRRFAGNLRYQIEATDSTSGPWSPIWNSSDGLAHPLVLSAATLSDRIDVTIRDSSPILRGTRRFLRLRATEP